MILARERLYNSTQDFRDFAAVFEIRVQTACLDFRIWKTALKVTRSVCLRAFEPAMSSPLRDLRNFCGLVDAASERRI
jgi:hypothetical protein